MSNGIWYINNKTTNRQEIDKIKIEWVDNFPEAKVIFIEGSDKTEFLQLRTITDNAIALDFGLITNNLNGMMYISKELSEEEFTDIKKEWYTIFTDSKVAFIHSGKSNKFIEFK